MKVPSVRCVLADPCALCGTNSHFFRVGHRRVEETRVITRRVFRLVFTTLLFLSSFLLISLFTRLFNACDIVLIKTVIGTHQYHLALVASFLVIMVFTGIVSSIVFAVTVFNVALAMRAPCTI